MIFVKENDSLQDVIDAYSGYVHDYDSCCDGWEDIPDEEIETARVTLGYLEELAELRQKSDIPVDHDYSMESRIDFVKSELTKIKIKNDYSCEFIVIKDKNLVNIYFIKIDLLEVEPIAMVVVSPDVDVECLEYHYQNVEEKSINKENDDFDIVFGGTK